MAAVSECFSVGSTVSCVTCYKKEIEGEVLAFDFQSKMLVLKCPASNGRPSSNNIYIVNLSFVSDVQVKKEVSPKVEPPQSLNLNRINTRVRNQLEEKQRLITALKGGVSAEGRKLFLSISKTIPQITWQGPNIVVLNQVTITPPYKPENVSGKDGKAHQHIRKLVEKYEKEMQAEDSLHSVPGLSKTSTNHLD
ncbi:unnamed protein product [Bemisia tabaci]|uniref:AD domain-containing protein n=1 Tax=Bemisia tabaci TaxID=7038 RepID=A0A9P0AFG2_BEMTA|nr:PREDICTED: protein LSM12 homolog [Bemisia tabaci]CAH0390670.1 unnamed protein product [Bemisia tabaci]